MILPIPGRITDRMTDKARPLNCFKVIEVSASDAPLTTRLANAMAGKIAADLGATVIRVEPPDGDPLRRQPPFLGVADTQGVSALFQFLASSKQFLALDRTRPDGEAVLGRLIDQCDAVLTDDADLAARPGQQVRVLVRPCSNQSDGQGPVEEIEILAVGGLLDIIGDPSREPLKLAGHQCAYTAGLAAFTGLVAALALRERRGPAELVDVSVLDVAYWTNWKSFAERLYTGRTPTRLGELTEWQVVACRDGHAAIVYLDKDWPVLCRMIEAPDLDTAAFATREARAGHQALILSRLRDWFRSRTRAEMHDAARTAGLPIAPVVRLGELAADPQMLAQGFLTEFRHEMTDSALIPTVPVVWNGRRFAPRPPNDLTVSAFP